MPWLLIRGMRTLDVRVRNQARIGSDDRGATGWTSGDCAGCYTPDRLGTPVTLQHCGK